MIFQKFQTKIEIFFLISTKIEIDENFRPKSRFPKISNKIEILRNVRPKSRIWKKIDQNR